MRLMHMQDALDDMMLTFSSPLLLCLLFLPLPPPLPPSYSATRTQNVLGEKGRRIRELTSLIQKRFNFPEGNVVLYAERYVVRCVCRVECDVERDAMRVVVNVDVV